MPNNRGMLFSALALYTFVVAAVLLSASFLFPTNNFAQTAQGRGAQGSVRVSPASRSST